LIAVAVVSLLERFYFRKTQSTSRKSSGGYIVWRRSIFLRGDWRRGTVRRIGAV
jgi:hypothetical protein